MHAVQDQRRQGRKDKRKNSPNGEFALEIVCRICAKHRIEFLQTVESLVLGTRTLQGLKALSCFEDVGEGHRFLWRECWVSEQKLEERLQSERIRALMGAIRVLGEVERIEVLAVSGRSKASLVWT
jgi:quinol monooxygenase YgiN